MSVRIYGYKGCGSCKKALGFLQRRDVAIDEVDITATPPTKRELATMLERLGGNIRKLFNTSGQAYRELGLSAKLDGMSSADALALLAANGKLVKRPFLVVDGEPVAVGFDAATWADLI